MSPYWTGIALDILVAVATLYLVSLGLWLSYGMLRVINLAHGDMMMLGAYSTAIAAPKVGSFWIAAGLSALVVSLFGYAMEALVLRRLYKRDVLSTLLASWGVSLLLCEAVRMVFGPSGRYVPSPISGTARIVGAAIPNYSLLLCGIAASVLLLGALFMRFSRLGLVLRGVLEDGNRAELFGVNYPCFRRIVFICSCALTGLAGALVAPLAAVTPYMGSDFTMRSFLAIVVGGMGSSFAPAIGSAAVAGTWCLLSSLLGYSSASGLTYIALVIGTAFRPEGISRRL